MNKENLQLEQQFLKERDIKIEEEIPELPNQIEMDDSSFDLDPGDIKEETSIFSSDLSNSESQPTNRYLQPPEELKKYTKPRIHPYRFRDYRREILTRHIQLQRTSQFYQDIFKPETKIQDVKRKERIINKINQLFLFQEISNHVPFNTKINRIENVIDCAIEVLTATQQISEPYDKISSLQRKLYPLEKFNCLTHTRKNILRSIPLFTKLFEKFYYRTQIIVTSFIEKIIIKDLLPINLKITIDSVEYCQDKYIIPTLIENQQFWTLRIYNKLGFGIYFFNPTQLRGVASKILNENPETIELVNLHSDDPRKFHCIKNLSIKDTEETIKSMLPSDIGWLFQYEDIKVKQFMELTHFMFTD